MAEAEPEPVAVFYVKLAHEVLLIADGPDDLDAVGQAFGVKGVGIVDPEIGVPYEIAIGFVSVRGLVVAHEAREWEAASA